MTMRLADLLVYLCKHSYPTVVDATVKTYVIVHVGVHIDGLKVLYCIETTEL